MSVTAIVIHLARFDELSNFGWVLMCLCHFIIVICLAAINSVWISQYFYNITKTLSVKTTPNGINNDNSFNSCIYVNCTTNLPSKNYAPFFVSFISISFHVCSFYVIFLRFSTRTTNVDYYRNKSTKCLLEYETKKRVKFLVWPTFASKKERERKTATTYREFRVDCLSFSSATQLAFHRYARNTIRVY